MNWILTYIIDGCFADSENLTITEKSSLYYICGYIAHKENIVCVDDGDDVELPDEAEFTLNVSRGKLELSPIILYDLFQYCYSFLKLEKEKCSTKVYLKAFSMIQEGKQPV